MLPTGRCRCNLRMELEVIMYQLLDFFNFHLIIYFDTSILEMLIYIFDSYLGRVHGTGVAQIRFVVVCEKINVTIWTDTRKSLLYFRDAVITVDMEICPVHRHNI